MRIYTSYKTIPELQGLPRKFQKQAWNATYFKACRDWREWLSLIVWMIVGVSGLLFAQHLEQVWFGGRTTASFLVCGLIAGVINAMGMIVNWCVLVHLMRPLHREYVVANQLDMES